MNRIRLIAMLWIAVQPLPVPAAEWSARPLSEIAVFPQFRAPASVVAVDEARIAAEVGGRIVALPARVGETVAKGAELARIDDASYRIELQRTGAQVELIANRVKLAEAQLEQARTLADKRFLSPDALRIRETEVAVLKSELDAARQSVAAARLQLARTSIRAPYAGVVRERAASVGDLAVPGTPLLVLSATANTEVRARVPSAQVAGLRATGRWEFVAGERRHALKLARISPVVEAAGQAQDVVFSSPAPLAPGLAGELRWTSTVPHLPPAFLQQREGRLGAYVERGGEAVFVPLPAAQAGRPAPLEWTPDTRIVDEGRFAIGLPAASRPEPAK